MVHLGTYSGELKIDNESEDAKFFSYNETQNLEIAFAYKTVLDDLYNAGLIV